MDRRSVWCPDFIAVTRQGAAGLGSGQCAPGDVLQATARRRKLQALPMRASTFNPLLRQRWAWLFLLALLLPIAQSAAICHGYQHVQVELGEHQKGQALAQAAHCDLCLIAATVAGGAWWSGPPGLPILRAGHALPPLAHGSVWQALPMLAYLSRAPPAAPR